MSQIQTSDSKGGPLFENHGNLNCHSALSLLVSCVLADHTDYVLALHDAAAFA